MGVTGIELVSTVHRLLICCAISLIPCLWILLSCGSQVLGAGLVGVLCEG